ncbi:MAG TPA: M20 family metallopeptidase [Acidimicrobiales bacterium]|nr:M20 family metallopeptidase [Acidimicrobiales bacterium]
MKEHVDRDRIVELTRSLVAVNTSNPPGNEAAVSDLLREALRPWGATWEEVEPQPGRLSLVARLPPPANAPPTSSPVGQDAGAGGPRRPTLIVNGHTDVVPALAGRWRHDPFDPVARDGRLYGRGTADMKGGVAAAICALDTVRAAGHERACDVVFQFVADEEKGGALGTRVLMEKGLLRGDACIVPEPTSLAVSVAERGLLQGEIVVKGRPGHGSRPREGVSAIEHGAQIVLALHAADYGETEHPLLGAPTANVGKFHGGSAVNVVAEEARVGFDRRLLPGTSLDEAIDSVRKRIDAAGLEAIDYQIEVDDYGEGSEMSPEDPFALLVKDCVSRVTGSAPPTIGMTFTTDARFVRNQGGIPAVVCGPGNIAQAHGIDEWVDIDQLVEAAAAYAELYRSFGSGWLSGHPTG